MNMENGKLINVINDEGLHLFNTFIIDSAENKLTVRLIDSFALNNFFVGSQMTLAYEIGKELYIVKGIIKSILPADGAVELKIESNTKVTNKRMRKRYPVSLFAEVYSHNEDPAFAYVINVSLTGLSITSRIDYENGTELLVNMFNDMSVIRLDAEVVWKFNINNFYKYGLKLKNTTPQTEKDFRSFLKRLSSERKKLSK